ncbi:cyclin-dependent kinase-like 5 isoform X2 [Girardinichthys multiradiatus]|uniref:cyclin-dependent kinase-like 5 isoform X2 n=1 Tax=Girardinichthys multiradiatus TaxID=208333 RepID=UPI001FAC3767|nr:cyclin-dependent kinase-like 5 isoform X2 [Girardinichthys multiradiatus]
MERYESLGPVGEGSYGTVLKCRHRDSGRLVAIKKFVDSDNDKTVKKIALREIKLLRQLRHDNLVNLLEVWKRRRRWYLVFEFVDRTLLDELEQKSSGLDLNTCQQYLFQILRAANFCHQQNVIHRDIKPENILISQEGVVKLCDFGFARTIASPSEGGVYTDYVATRWYRAPELLVGDIKYGKPVDVWALGCLLIEMLTGQPLFPGDSDLDQIYHIVRCFGNLTAHHQELFHRNPIFSGVKLPECSKTVPLQQRFPTIPPTALDLAQKCLEMDPKRRAQCSNLLDHLLFTQGSFSIRFLDELNTKIQKKHRENSTLPKIPKTTLQDDGKGEDKNCISKDKKQLEEMEEKGNKEKMEKTKGKQPPKLFKSIHNTTESFMTKQPKTFSNKAINHTEQLSMKPEKTSSSGLKELEVLKSTKICISESADVTKTAVSLKKKSSLAATPKHEWGVSPDTRKDHLHNAKDIDYSNQDSEKILLIGELLKSEPSKEFVRSLSNLSLNISKLSKIAITDGQSLNSSPKTVLESDASVEPTFPLLSFNDYTVPTMLDVTRSGKTSLALKVQTDILDGDAKQNSSECPKVQPKNPRKSQIISTSVQQNHDNTSISHSRAAVDLSSQTFMTVREPSAAYNLSALPRGISHSTVPKTTYSTKTPSKDKEPTENHEMRKYHRYPKLNPMTETPTKPIVLSHILDGDRESSEPYFAFWQSNVITEEVKLTSTPVLDENLSVEKAQTVSVKENQEDLPISVCINKTLKPPERSANDRGNNSSQEFRFDVKTLNLSHHSQHPTTGQSFSDHLRSSVNPKTQNITFTPDAKKKSNKLEINSTHMSTYLTSVMSGDHKALTRSLILHEKDTADIDEFNYSVLQSCTPSPPPAPAANCLHLPPSFRTLAPTIFLSSSNSPAPSDHLIQGGGSHTGTNSLRKIDQPFGLNHATRSFAFQASGNSFINERSKNSVHFPDVRSSVLPELSGKEAKQNKGATKEQRTEKTPVSSDGQ